MAIKTFCRLKQIIFYFIFSFLGFNLPGQQPCITPYDVGDYLGKIEKDEIVESSNNYVIRVFFHLMRRSDGTGGQSIQNVNDGLNKLVEAFEPHGICVSLLGIDEILDDFYYNLDFTYFMLGDNNGDGKFDNFSPNSHANAIDIYLFPENGNLIGGASPTIVASAVVIGGTAYNTNWGTSHFLSHEIGHCLGLFHTFHGYPSCEPSGCQEFVNGTNCIDCGDLVCDTDADPQSFGNLHGTCTWNNIDCGFTTNPVDPNNDPYSPPMTNIMAYTIPSCMVGFTNGQGGRMRLIIANGPSFLQNIIVPNTIVLTNLSINPNEHRLYDVLNGLTLNGGAVSQNGSLELRAGDYIVLNSSIDIQNSAFFHAYIDNLCSVIDQNNSAKNISVKAKGDSGYSLVTRIEEGERLKINIFPNPVIDLLSIYIESKRENNLSILIVSDVGMICKKVIIKIHKNEIRKMQFDFSRFAPGLYFIRIFNHNYSNSKAIIKK